VVARACAGVFPLHRAWARLANRAEPENKHAAAAREAAYARKRLAAFDALSGHHRETSTQKVDQNTKAKKSR
jgi:hypothetical protein